MRARSEPGRRLALLVAGALAAAAGEAQALRISPRLDVSETWTDNAALRPDDLAASDWVTDVAPGLRVEHLGAHSRLFVDARWHRLIHRHESSLDSTQRFLEALGTVEAIDNRLALDARASIDQMRASAFGAASTPGVPTTNANRVETRALQLSPHAHGPITDLAVYNARVTFTDLRADDPAYHDTRTASWNVRATNATRSAKVGWAVDATGLNARNDSVGSREDMRFRASAIAEVLQDLHLSVSDGYERTDFAGEGTQGTSTPGAGIEWSPGPRTQLAAVAERRFFGTGHQAQFSHRTAFTAWRVESTRDATFLPAQVAAVHGVGTLQGLFADLLAAAIPDPALRAETARQRMEAVGLPPASPLDSSYLSSNAFIANTRKAAVAYVAPRNTVALEYTWREHKTIPGAVTLTPLPEEDTRQRRWVLTATHALTPQTRVVLAAARLDTDGTVGGAPEQSKQRLATATLRTRLGRHAEAALSLRHDRFDSTTAPSYKENAIVLTFSLRM